MKKIFSIICGVLLFGTAYSQTMFIHKTNHSVESIFTADIDSIVFNSDSTTCPVAIDYEGHKYKTVLIGKQCWMAQSLKSTVYADGTPMVDGSAAGNISGQPAAAYYFWYKGIQGNADIYGLLYTWAAAMNGANSSSATPSGVQGVCPAGWHLPSIAEWDTLATFISNDNGGYIHNGVDWENVGGHLKSTLLWGALYPGNGTDDYGFDGRPGGHRGMLANYDDLNTFGYFWSATEDNTTNAYPKRLEAGNGDFIQLNYPKNTGYSIRCIKN